MVFKTGYSMQFLEIKVVIQNSISRRIKTDKFKTYNIDRKNFGIYGDIFYKSNN